MDSKVQEKLTALFAAAINAGDNEVLETISPLIDLDERLEAVRAIDISKLAHLDSILSVKSPQEDEINRIFSRLEAFVFSGQGNRIDRNAENYLKSFVDRVKGDEERRALIRNFCKVGFYKEAWQTYLSLDDRQAYIDECHDITQSRSGNPFYYKVVLGHPYNWNKEAMRLFYELGLPGYGQASVDKMHDYRELWSSSRVKAQIYMVGDALEERGLGIPQLRAKEDGEPEVMHNATLIASYLEEYKRVMAAGGHEWDVKNLPRYVPVVLSGEDSISTELVRIIPNSRIGKKYHHGFFDPEGKLSCEEVSGAVAVLPIKEINRLMCSEQPLYLAPLGMFEHGFINSSKENLSEESILRVEMFSFRPEPILHDIWRIAENAKADCYLKGMPTDQLYNGSSVEFYGGLITKDEFDYIQYTKCESGSHLRYCINEQNIKEVSQKMEEDTRYFENLYGFLPRISINLEDQDQLKALSKLYKIGNIRYFQVYKKGRYELYNFAINDRYVREGACLGAYWNTLTKEYGSTMEEVFLKAVRIRDDKAIACGYLDRFPVEDIIRLVTTDAQFKFVREHFDVTDHIDKFPKKYQSQLRKAKLASDLEL